ncbi:MAG: TIGR04255 family protein [Desulfobaccales bacterium]
MHIYKKNFLNRVIARINFQPINSIRTSLDTNLSKTALELFPISEPKKELTGLKLQFSLKDENIKREEVGKKAEWHYFGMNREKHLVIATDFMSVEYLKFDNFDNFIGDFFGIMEILFRAYKDVQVSQTALRYINIINLEEDNPIDWNNYLNDNLLSIFNVPFDRNTISRAFQVLELNYGDMNLRFQYGMINPDFPAVIRKKEFILDYDAFCSGLKTEIEIRDNINRFNLEIEKLFERCIKANLKEIMNGN